MIIDLILAVWLGAVSVVVYRDRTKAARMVVEQQAQKTATEVAQIARQCADTLPQVHECQVAGRFRMRLRGR